MTNGFRHLAEEVVEVVMVVVVVEVVKVALPSDKRSWLFRRLSDH